MIPVNNNGRLLLLIETPLNSQVRTSRAVTTVCQCLGISLDQGYFFRVTEHNGSVGNKPFTGSAASNRLMKHLLESKLHAGETPHSFWMGLSNTLRLLGYSQEEVAQY